MMNTAYWILVMLILAVVIIKIEDWFIRRANRRYSDKKWGNVLRGRLFEKTVDLIDQDRK